jgi:nitroreductase
MAGTHSGDMSMEFTEVINKRRMVRNFTDEPVSEEVLERILHAARRAPSAGFSQGQSYIVITRPDLKQQVAVLCGEESYTQAGFDPFVSSAAVQIIPCTNEQIYHRR